MKLVIVTTVMFYAATSLYAASIDDEALRFHLNQQGLDILADEVRAKSLGDIEDQAIPNQEHDVTGGIHVNVEDANFSARFPDFQLDAENNLLKATIAVSDLRLFIPRLKMKKRILGSTLRTTCKNTLVKVGHQSDREITADIALRIDNHQIKVDIDQVNFDVDSKNFEIHGPEGCTGDLGTGFIIRAIVRTALDNSRAQIVAAVERRIANLDGDLAEKLNAMVTQNLSVEMPEHQIITAKRLLLQTFPTDLTLRDDDLAFILGVRPEVGKSSLRKSAKSKSKNKIETIIGDVGISPSLFNETLSLMIRSNPDPIWLDAAAAPGLNEVLKQQNAASIWPDLASRQLDSEVLEVAFCWTKTPTILLRPDDQITQVDFTGIALDFYVREDGNRRHYFSWDITLSLDLKIDMQPEGILRLTLATQPKLALSGKWPDEAHRPQLDLFEQDVAEVIFAGIFDFLLHRGPLFQYQIPPFSAASGALYAEEVVVEEKYISLKIGSKR